MGYQKTHRRQNDFFHVLLFKDRQYAQANRLQSEFDHDQTECRRDYVKMDQNQRQPGEQESSFILAIGKCISKS